MRDSCAAPGLARVRLRGEARVRNCDLRVLTAGGRTARKVDTGLQYLERLAASRARRGQGWTPGAIRPVSPAGERIPPRGLSKDRPRLPWKGVGGESFSRPLPDPPAAAPPLRDAARGSSPAVRRSAFLSWRRRSSPCSRRQRWRGFGTMSARR